MKLPSDIVAKLTSTKSIIIGVTLIILIFVIVMTVQSFAPRKGNILYGICTHFIELQLQFPDTIKQKEIELYRKGVRIYYTHMNGYGEERLEMSECSFRQSPQAGVQLENVYFNYVKNITAEDRIIGKGRLYEVKPEYIDLFNRSLSPAAVLEDNKLVIPDGAYVRRY